MNKSQVEHFQSRVKRARYDVKENILQEYPLIPNPTTEELVGLVLSGKAIFKSRLVDGLNCSRIPGGSVYNVLCELFEIDQLADIDAINQEKTKFIDTNILPKVEKEGKFLLDKLVFGGIEDPASALKEFINKDYLTQEDHAYLAKLTRTLEDQ